MTDEAVPCPGCSGPMELEQEVCGFCRRPRDEFEIEKGRDLVRERAERSRRRPYVIARRIAAAAVLVFAYIHRDFFTGRVTALRAEIRREREAIEAPSESAAPPPPKTAVGAAAVALLGGPPATRPATPSHASTPDVPAAAPGRTSPPSAAAPAPPAPPKLAVRPPAPPAPPRGVYRIYGVVFDMKTLEPVPWAVVTLKPSGSTVATDRDGHYVIDQYPLSMMSGATASDPLVLISVRAKGYLEGQIEDTDVSYLKRPRKERLEDITEVSPEDLEDVPVRFRDDEDLVPLDLVLVPAPK